MWIRYCVLLGLLLSRLAWAEINEMSVDELAASIGNPRLVVLDVRSSTSWRYADEKIQSAVRVDSLQIPTLSARYDKDTILVLYCD